MKIQRLDLRAFGPFSEVVLDLSGGSEGLHVIYGPNEAGKSSALRALEQMLFGIPPRSADGFRHPNQDLRIGATLSGRGAATLEFLRRKGTKGTLLGTDNRTPLDEHALKPFLAALDRNLFSTMFAIGHEQLVEGGRQIVRGEGDVGQILFAAGAGIADLREVQQQLQEQAESLFVPRGSARVINQHLAALDEARKRLRQSQLHSEDWTQRDKELRETAGRLTQVEAEFLDQQRERNRLDRIRRALPLIAKRRQCLGQLESLGAVTILPEDFAERRRLAVTESSVAGNEARAAQAEIERIDEQLRSLVIPEALLALADQIKQLPNRLGSHRQGQDDLPGLKAKKAQVEREAASILRQLRPDLDLASADRICLTRQEQIEIKNLGNRHAGLVQQQENAEAEIERSESRLKEVVDRLSGLEPPRDATALKDAVRRVQGLGDLERQRAVLQAAQELNAEQAAADLARLTLWSGSLEDAERMPLPTEQTVDRFEADEAQAEQRERTLLEETRRTTAELSELERQVEQLRLEGEVPSEQDLLRARHLRDQGWQLVAQSWLGPPPETEAVQTFLAQFEPGLDLAAAYRRAVETADVLSDRLRREARRVAERASLQARQTSLERQSADLRKQLDQARQAIGQIQEAWRACWQPAGVQPLRPREMRAWLARHRGLCQQAQAIRAQRGQLQQIDEQIVTWQRDLESLLGDLGEPPAGERETLAARVRRSVSVVEGIEAAEKRREQWEKDARQLRSDGAAARRKFDKAEADLRQWQAQWGLALEPLGLAPNTSPDAANEVVTLIAELFKHLDSAQELCERITGIGDRADQFFRLVNDLAEKADPALAAQGAEPAAEEMMRRLQQARADLQNRDSLRGEKERHEKDREKACRRQQQWADRLAALCQEAGCAHPEDLPEAERKSDAARRLRETLTTVEDQLLGLGSGATLEEFLAEAEAVEPDALPQQIEHLDGQIRESDRDRQALAETKGRLRTELGQMDGRSDATEAAEEIQQHLASIESDARQYARLRLGLAVLREGIERYRKKNEGPVLRRASELFRELTLGSFEGLRADFDEQGKSVMMGVRPGGEKTVGLAGMSDGTCDQLYLALRLASLEKYLHDEEPIPFVFDDILISFDDRRAAAALRVLAQLSGSTQVVFFTHHEHLVELARANVDEGSLFVHEL